ncbi:hypothetical protein MFLAVUS_002110 [Mucor flavus]|uniref:F-box domain-containing protein n=1 Tax=Mucor flavus TaxID=439312 RepID=A0ABP9YPE2_9FUNG
MMCTSRNKCLPPEVLQQVFRNLGRKEDRKTCLLVCRPWNSVAQAYFNRDILIKVKETKLDDLLDDISYFGQNVKTIKLIASRPKTIDEDNEIKWRQILKLCPYLTSVYFKNSCNGSAFLKALQDPDLKLNDLQKLDIYNLTAYSRDIHDIYLWVSIQYCQTITSLQLCASDEELVSTKYGGLYKFISQFPQLTCLKVTRCPSYLDVRGLLYKEEEVDSIVDIKNILEEAPRLKEIKLYGCDVAIKNSADTNAAQLIENGPLTDLKILADNTSISTMRYIVSLLKEVKILALIIGKITVDEDISVEESETILGDLEASTSEMKRVEIKYNYNGRDFYLNTGKEFKIKSRSKGRYKNENYFSSGDDDSDYDSGDDSVDYNVNYYDYYDYNEDSDYSYNYDYSDNSDYNYNYHGDLNYNDDYFYDD